MNPEETPRLEMVSACCSCEGRVAEKRLEGRRWSTPPRHRLTRPESNARAASERAATTARTAIVADGFACGPASLLAQAADGKTNRHRISSVPPTQKRVPTLAGRYRLGT